MRYLGIYICNFLYYIGNPLYDSLDEATWKAEACKRLPNLKKLDGEPVIREVQEWIYCSCYYVVTSHICGYYWKCFPSAYRCAAQTLHAECFPSDRRQQCEHYYYTLYPSTCLTDENRKHTYLVKEDATIPCSLLSPAALTNNAQKCELLQHLAAKRCWLSQTRQVFKEWCQPVVLFVTHRNCAILTTTVPPSDIPLLKRQKVCGLANSSKLAF